MLRRKNCPNVCLYACNALASSTSDVDTTATSTSDVNTTATQATEVAAKLHVPVSETAEWAALMDHVAEIDKTCALLAIVLITAIRRRSSLV